MHPTNTDAGERLRRAQQRLAAGVDKMLVGLAAQAELLRLGASNISPQRFRTALHDLTPVDALDAYAGAHIAWELEGRPAPPNLESQRHLPVPESRHLPRISYLYRHQDPSGRSWCGVAMWIITLPETGQVITASRGTNDGPSTVTVWPHAHQVWQVDPDAGTGDIVSLPPIPATGS